MSINIYQRKDGRYEGRITMEKVNGKRKYKAFFGRTSDEVMKKMTDFHAITTCKGSTKKLFSVVYSEWFNSVLYRVKESTAANYTLKADKHILPVFGNQNISDISQNSIHRFIREKQDCGLSNRYITDILILMKSVFRYAARTYHINNPMDGMIMPKKQKSEIRLLTIKEEEQLMQIINKNQNLTTLGIALAKMTGLRIGELCALRWKDTPVRMFYFVASPLPWSWRGLSDIIAFFFSSLVFLYVYYRAYQELKKGDTRNRTMILIFVVLSLCSALIFAWGVSNAGTAVRHREKFIVIYMVLFALCNSNEKIEEVSN